MRSNRSYYCDTTLAPPAANWILNFETKKQKGGIVKLESFFVLSLRSSSYGFMFHADFCVVKVEFQTFVAKDTNILYNFLSSSL